MSMLDQLKALLPDVSNLFNIPTVKQNAAEVIETMQYTSTELVGMGQDTLNAHNAFGSEMSEMMTFRIKAMETELRMATKAQKEAYKLMIAEMKLIEKGWQNMIRGFTDTVGSAFMQPLNRMFDDFRNEQTNDFAKFVVNLMQMFMDALVTMLMEWLAFKLMTGILSGGISTIGDSAIGMTIPRIKPFKFASGGYVEGYYKKSGTDTVPAMLTPGEYVLPKAIGGRNLGDQITRMTDPNQRGGQNNATNRMAANTLNLHISTMDGKSVQDFVYSEDFKNALAKAFNQGKLKMEWDADIAKNGRVHDVQVST